MRWQLALVTAAVIAVVAIVLGVLLIGWESHSNPAPPNSCGDCGTAFALSPAKEQGGPGAYWYNFTVQSASGAMTLGELAFQVQSSTGQPIDMENASIVVYGVVGAAVASYSVATAQWTAGGSTLVSNEQTIVLRCSNDLSSVGDVLVVLGHGSFTESVSVSIP